MHGRHGRIRASPFVKVEAMITRQELIDDRKATPEFHCSQMGYACIYASCGYDCPGRLSRTLLSTDKWDLRYLELARHVAQWSKDPSTKVGAVVVGADRREIALGYNGFPPGIKDDDRLADRPIKHRLIQHAERNVLDNARFDLLGATLIVTLHPCTECTKSIISKRIIRVVCPEVPQREPWASEAAVAGEILKEAGIAVDVVRNVG